MAYLKEDGSLDIERINSLPLREYMDAMGDLTQEQVEEYLSKLPFDESNEPMQASTVDWLTEEELVDAEEFLNNQRKKYGIRSEKQELNRFGSMIELKFFSQEFEKVALEESEPPEELEELIAWHRYACELLTFYEDIATRWRHTRINDKGEEETFIDEEAWKNTSYKTWLDYSIGKFNVIYFIDSLQYDINIKICYINQREKSGEKPLGHVGTDEGQQLISYILKRKTDPVALERLHRFVESLGCSADKGLDNSVLDGVQRFVESLEYKSDTDIIAAMDERERIWNKHVMTMSDINKHRSIIAYFIYLKDDELINTFPVSCYEILQHSTDYLQAVLNKGVSDPSKRRMLKNSVYDGIRILITSSVVML